MLVTTPLLVTMYTRGTASGHLSRVNALYKGFRRAGLPVVFSAAAPRSKYLALLDPGIRRVNGGQLPRCDIFICDWLADEHVTSLARAHARLWVGLRRFGTIAREFPEHYYVVGLEPGVVADVTIWPILATWQDEVLTRKAVRRVLNVLDDRPVALLCENGAYARHLAPVLTQPVAADYHVFRCSNSPFSHGVSDLYYYPIAEMFGGVDRLILGGGYNSVHEALSYADVSSTQFVHVGGDDQERRLAECGSWERGRGSRAAELATHLYETLHDRTRPGARRRSVVGGSVPA